MQRFTSLPNFSVFCFMFYTLKRGCKTIKLNQYYCNTPVTHYKTIKQNWSGK